MFLFLDDEKIYQVPTSATEAKEPDKKANLHYCVWSSSASRLGVHPAALSIRTAAHAQSPSAQSSYVPTASAAPGKHPSSLTCPAHTVTCDNSQSHKGSICMNWK
jgi:hypothetical protein